ncbi:hypothetical protein ABH897_003358 [Paenibacillus sp. RC73]
MKQHIQQKRTPQLWSKALIPGLILPGLLLAACQQGGSGGQESEPLKSSPTTQESVQPATQSNAGNSSGTETGTGQASVGTGSGQADPVMALRSESALQATVKEDGGTAIVTNATADTVVVNKKRSLPVGYAPDDLVEPKVPFSFEGPHEKRQRRWRSCSTVRRRTAWSCVLYRDTVPISVRFPFSTTM